MDASKGAVAVRVRRSGSYWIKSIRRVVSLSGRLPERRTQHCNSLRDRAGYCALGRHELSRFGERPKLIQRVRKSNLGAGGKPGWPVTDKNPVSHADVD